MQIQNNSTEYANKILRDRGRPNLEEIINQEKHKVKNFDRKLYEAFIGKEAYKYKSIQDVNDAFENLASQGTTYDMYITGNLPNVQDNTPGISRADQNKINLKLIGLKLPKPVDHTKFTILENGGLAVKTSKGDIRITQLSDTDMFLKKTCYTRKRI